MNKSLMKIQGYLSYNLRAIDPETKQIRVVTLEHFTYDLLTVGLNMLLFESLTNKKHIPVLFPIESIFQKVDFWGERICVVDLIVKNHNRVFSSKISLEKCIDKIKKAISKQQIELLPHEYITVFQEYHVDYQYMIKQGEAFSALNLK